MWFLNVDADMNRSRWLRKADPKARVHLVANKLEGDANRWMHNINDCFQLGLGTAIAHIIFFDFLILNIVAGEPIPLSAEHGEGLTDLVDIIAPVVDQYERDLAAVAVQKELEANGEVIDESILEDPETEQVCVGQRFQISNTKTYYYSLEL